MATDTGPLPLHDLIRYHGRLYVHPLEWTPRHLDLVGCQFQDVASEERAYKADENQRDTSASDAEEIATNPIYAFKSRSLGKILVGEEHAFIRVRAGSPFYFEGRSVHRPRYTIFHRHGEPQNYLTQGSPPLVGYLHYNFVIGDRGRRFDGHRPPPRGIRDWVGQELRCKKLAKIEPKNWIEDQYLVCILLALAQIQERKLKGTKPASYISRLIVGHVLENESMLFYEAEITAELLEVLQSPKTATIYRPWPTIKRKKIPYKPYNTFAGRLTAELVAPTSSSYKRSTISDSVLKRQLEDESIETSKTRQLMA